MVGPRLQAPRALGCPISTSQVLGLDACTHPQRLTKGGHLQAGNPRSQEATGSLKITVTSGRVTQTQMFGSQPYCTWILSESVYCLCTGVCCLIETTKPNSSYGSGEW